jgi:hypothetical protein
MGLHILGIWKNSYRIYDYRINDLFLKGGLAFIGFKGALKIYYQHDLITRQLKREIRNYKHD